MQRTQRGDIEHDDVLDADPVAQRVDGRGGVADLLVADVEPVKQCARRNGERGLSQPGARRAEHLALHKPPE